MPPLDRLYAGQQSGKEWIYIGIVFAMVAMMFAYDDIVVSLLASYEIYSAIGYTAATGQILGVFMLIWCASLFASKKIGKFKPVRLAIYLFGFMPYFILLLPYLLGSALASSGEIHWAADFFDVSIFIFLVGISMVNSATLMLIINQYPLSFKKAAIDE